MKKCLCVSILVCLALFLTLGATNAFAETVNLEVKDSGNNWLAGVKVYYNDYGNHYVLLGTTNGSGQVTANIADGTYNFKAVKDHTEQIKSGVVPGLVSFQTSKFVVHVKDSDDSDFPGIAVSFNDYGNHYLSMGNTDGSGNASIELFPGARTFKATKNHTYDTADLTISSSGTSNTVNLQTSEFVVHVTKSDGSDFPGIAVSFNDYGNHYLSMGATDGSGNASIELFPGIRTFKATKDHTNDTGDLTVDTPGGNGIIEFQTSLAIGFVKDCDNSDPIEGIQVAFNDYGNHWLNFGPTGSDGKASIELFAGDYDLRAVTNHTSQVMPISLSGTSTLVEFNPTKLCFSYSGTVKYNDYGNHWMTITCGTYLFPGTYDFKFDGIVQEDVNISGCLMDGSVLIITLKNSSGAGVPGGKAELGVGGWPYIGDTDANGNLVYIHSSTLGNMRVRMTAPNNGGTQTSPSQDVSINSYFNFQTSEIVIQLLNSVGALTDGGIVKINDGGWPVIGTTGDDGTGIVKHEHFLPYVRTFRMSYNYGTEEMSQDIGANPLVIFQTGLVKLWFSGTIQHGVGGWPSYVNPTEMLPVEHRFGFSGSGNPRTELKFTPTSGEVLEKTIAYIRVKNSDETGQSDYTAEWHKYGGPTSVVDGTPDGNGVLLNAMEGHNTTNTNHTAKYLGATLGIWQNPSANSFYIFQLYAVTVELRDNAGEIISTAAPDIYFHYYGAGELLFGTMSAGTVTKDLLPGGSTYFFNIKNYSFNGSQGGVSGQVNTNPKVFTFQTGKVVDGVFGCAEYWQYGGPHTTFSEGVQLLPGNFYFKDGTTKNFQVVAGQVLVLQLVAGSGTLSSDYGSPTVDIDAYLSGSDAGGTFDITYPTGTGHTYQGANVSGDIICARFNGSEVYLAGEVTVSNSSSWLVRDYMRFGIQDDSPDQLNYTPGESTPPDCGTVYHSADLPLVAGNFVLDPNGGIYSKPHGDQDNAEPEIVPIELNLAQNYPNPFNPSTTIVFTVKEANPTTLKVYNTLGQEVATLFKGTAEPGQFYKVEFNASNLASGIYIYRLQSGNNVSVKKMMMIK